MSLAHKITFNKMLFSDVGGKCTQYLERDWTKKSQLKGKGRRGMNGAGRGDEWRRLNGRESGNEEGWG